MTINAYKIDVNLDSADDRKLEALLFCSVIDL